MNKFEKLLAASDIFLKKAQVTYSGETLRGMLQKLLNKKFEAAVKNSSDGEYTLLVEYHLVPDKSKKRYDRTKSKAVCIIENEDGKKDRSKMSSYNTLTLGALIKYHEQDKLPSPLPPNHPGRRELKKTVDVSTINKKTNG